jgi:hypothetical protein
MAFDFDQLFPNRFLKAGELRGKDVTLTISNVSLEELDGDKGKQVKGVVSFKETPKSLVLNKTNGLCLKGMFGRDVGAWFGKRVTIFPAPIDFGDAEIAIRVRGSPDIEKDLDVEIKLARKKPRTVRMLKTGGKPSGNGKPATAVQTAVADPAPFPSESDSPFGEDVA